VKKHASLLPPADRPFPNTYWVFPDRLLAGEHPAGFGQDVRERLERLHLAGIDAFFDLTEEGEEPEYGSLLPAGVEYRRFPIGDQGVPLNVSETRALLTAIQDALARRRRVYLHCRAGIGRTGLVVGCLLAEESGDGKKALARLNELWQQSARATHQPRIPQTLEQADYIRHWLRLRALASAPSAVSIPPVSISEESENSALLPTPTGPLIVPELASDDAAGCVLSVIIPTYNEALNVEELLGRLHNVLNPTLPGAYEVILVDDDSPDRTWELAQRLAHDRPMLRVMRRTSERGLASAVARGWQVSRGTYLCAIDADLQHPPGAIVELLALMERGADMAVASRHVEGGGVSDWSIARRIVSRAGQLIGLIVLPSVVGRVSDPMSGYFMIRRSAIESVELSPLGYKILIEVLARGRFPWVGEVPYTFVERAYGGSKATARVYLDYLRHLTRLRFSSLPFNRFARFAVVGLSGVVVDMGLLFLLSDPTMLGWGLTRSKLIAAEVAIVNNFLWNDTWTFRDLSVHQRGFAQRLRRFGKFQLICLAGVLLNTLLLNLQFNLLHMNRYIANAVAIAAVTGWNFWLNLKVSWRVASPTHGAAPSASRIP
jgi:dolichol-phosphate mannosyltransferase